MSGVAYEERRAQVLALKAEGLTYRQIAERLGLSRSHVGHIASARTYETNLLVSRALKQQRRGTCEDCGAVTRYNGHRGIAASLRCLPCAAALTGEAARGTGPTQALVLAFIGDGELRVTEIVDGCGITVGIACSLLHRLLTYGILERPRRGVYRKKAA